MNLLTESTLREMPIRDYQLHGDFKQPGSFNDGHHYSDGYVHDAKIVTNPKAIDKIKRGFRKTPFNFEFHMVNAPDTPDYEDLLQTGELHQIDWTADALKQWFNLDIAIKPDAITVVLLGNNANERDQMSAWIVAHRFTHALWQHHQLVDDGIVPALSAAFERIAARLDAEPFSIYKQVLTMKSAREGRLDEPELEVLCQYLISGRVRLNRIDPAVNELIDALETNLNTMIETALHACVGKLFVWF